MTIPKGLTPKQSAFAGFVASGLSYSDAYKKAYETKGKDATVNVLASRLAKKNHVRQAIDDLKADKKEAKLTHEKLNGIEGLSNSGTRDPRPSQLIISWSIPPMIYLLSIPPLIYLFDPSSGLLIDRSLLWVTYSIPPLGYLWPTNN
jgi:hypothetical protein